jgi:hypothetical protein
MKRMQVHKATSFEDAERWDEQFWRRAGAAARFEAVWSMVGDFLKLRGKSGVQPRLRRSVLRIKRR